MKRLLVLLLVTLIVLPAIYLLRERKISYTDKPYQSTQSLKKCAQSQLPQNCILYQLSLNGQVNGFNSSVIFLDSIKGKQGIASICHNLSHQLGYKAFNYYQNITFINKNTLSGCEGGFIHGVFEQAAQESFKLKNGYTYCLALPIENDCSHALGHYFYIYLNGAKSNSVQACESYSHPKECLDGLFMARSLNEQNTDLHIYQSCSSLDKMAQVPCLRNAFYGLGMDALRYAKVSKISTLCKQDSEILSVACYEGLGYGSRSLLSDSSDPLDYIELCKSDREAHSNACLNFVLKQNKEIKDVNFFKVICSNISKENDLCILHLKE